MHRDLLVSIATTRFRVPKDGAEELADYVIDLSYKTSDIRDIRAWLIGAICNASRHYWRDRGREVPLDPLVEFTAGSYRSSASLRATRSIDFDRMGKFSFVELEVPHRASPPATAEWLMRIFVSRSNRPLIGDMLEEFPRLVAKHGARRARLLFWRDAAEAIAPAIIKLLRIILGLSVGVMTAQSFELTEILRTIYEYITGRA